MLQILRYLIFGKQCQHKWKLEKEMKPFDNVGMYLYSCQKCGKMKKVKFDLAGYKRA